MNIMLYSSGVIDLFLWDSRNETILIKVTKNGEVYKIKNTDILLYVSKTLNSRNAFNNEILLNLMKANNLKIDIVKNLCEKGVFRN